MQLELSSNRSSYQELVTPPLWQPKTEQLESRDVEEGH